MNLKGNILIRGQTDAGLYREYNEDTIGHDQNIALAVLADGMGGHRSGEIASAITVSTVLELAQKKNKCNEPTADNTASNKTSSRKIGSSTIGSSTISSSTTNTSEAATIDCANDYNLTLFRLQQAITLANKKVFEASQSNAQYRGMGTTVVAIQFYDNHICIAHVGDSRLYRLRKNQFEQITRDHSYVQDMLDCGMYTQEQAKNSNRKNIITRAIGISEEVQIDIQREIVETDDIYLLCSDGVNDMIDDDTIKTILLKNINNLDEAVSELIHSANKHGGKDNISALLAKVVKPFPVKTSWFSRLSNFLK